MRLGGRSAKSGKGAGRHVSSLKKRKGEKTDKEDHVKKCVPSGGKTRRAQMSFLEEGSMGGKNPQGVGGKLKEMCLKRAGN